MAFNFLPATSYSRKRGVLVGTFEDYNDIIDEVHSLESALERVFACR